MANNLAGQFDLAVAFENASLTAVTNTVTSNTVIANFSDGFTSDTPANFTATINWGDNQTTTGTVVGGDGSFTVEADHVYADEGTPTGVVTITRTTDGAQLVLQGNVTVDDNDNLTGHSEGTIPTNVNQPLNNIAVATFSDTTITTPHVPSSNSPSDFTVSIDWGDGTTTAGTLSGGSGTFTATGSHTYTAAGQFTITTFLADDGTNEAATAVATSTADVGFGGVVTSPGGSEFIAIPSGTKVATFADNAGDPASDYVATIDWGDGTVTGGSVTGSGGSFTVSSTAGHTYTDEGNFTETVTVTNTVNSSSITISGTETVAENDSLTAFGGPTVTASPGVSTGTVTVATFTDHQITPAIPLTNAPNVAGDFIATIHWGDGSSSTGTVSGPTNNTFTVTGAHTYTQSGQDTITVDISDDPANAQNTANDTAQTTALIGLAPVAGATLAATEGTPIAAGTQVATFSDSNLSDTAADFAATISWGDGTTSTGAAVTISGGSGSFTVSGGPHTYADEGQDVVTTTLTQTVGGSTSATATGEADVAEADVLSLTGDNFNGNAGQALTNQQVATFTDTYTGNVASDFTAAIAWGDGSTTPGTVSGSNGSFTVEGSHTYTAGGNHTFSVHVADDSFGTATASGTGTASINFSGQLVLTPPAEGMALPNTTPVATFSDSNLTDTASDFTASIDWGDQVTTPGSVVGSNGSFTIEGGHTYADEGSKTLSVTFTQTVEHATATITGSVGVTEADGLTGQGITFSAAAQTNFSGTVATFTDTNTGQVPGDIPATVDWGDGFTTVGTVTGSNGSYTVSGAHNYESGGRYTVTVTAADDAPGTASFTVTSTADVSYAGQIVLNSQTEGTTLPVGTQVATFNDFNGGDTFGQFTAMIAWGDGSPAELGTVVGSPGTFTVESALAHTYADEGSAPVSVTVTHSPDQVQGTFAKSVAVADADILSGQGTSFTASAQQPFSGTVATFADAYTGQSTADLAATINWGDGQTTTGTVSGGSGSFTVSGSHTYGAGPPQRTVTVTLADDAPSTVTATATTTASVTGGSIPFDFNGDSISDLVFQQEAFNAGSATGTPQIWLWNGSAVTSQVTFGNPGAGWHIVASRDMNGDGKSDLIWQNSDGTPGIWLMNGTTPIAEAGLGNPGASWRIAASGDTNGDGKSDLIWQNSDGTLGVWLMNGTTPIAEAGLGNPGANWKVVGTADYNADGKDDILLQDSNTGNLMIDLMNGTTITSSKTIAVGDPSWHAVSTGEFNGRAEIAWQNNDGTLGIWLMNGTSPAAAATLGNPGPAWQLISVDHFTPNGNADLLFQNTNGAMGMWQLNGTTVVAEMGLPSPGAGWQSENGHPISATVTNTAAANTNSAMALNAADPGNSGLHSSAPDSGVTGGLGTPSNLQHLTFAAG